MQRHTIGSVCGLDNSCRAYFALEPAGKLIFFVHGFGGGPTGSWRQFPELMLADDRWAGWDFFFYGYDSRRMRAGIAAQLLRDQVGNVINQPGYANAWLRSDRAKDFQYTEVWFVTHSLGAVLTRKVLVDAWRGGAKWLAISHLICFAPASTGARIERMMRLLGTTSGGLIGFIHALLRHRWTVLDDIQIGSAFLENLFKETREATREGPREPFYSRLTMFGAYENVVEYPPAFGFDSPPRLDPEADHRTVCKPRYPHDPAYFEMVNEIRP